MMRWSWPDFVWLAFFLVLFATALVANGADTPMSEVRGAWVAQALR
jgi:hypothetical protein